MVVDSFAMLPCLHGGTMQPHAYVHVQKKALELEGSTQTAAGATWGPGPSRAARRRAYA